MNDRVNSRAIPLLVRSGEPSGADWVKLLGVRHDAIAGHLSDPQMELRTLGRLTTRFGQPIWTAELASDRVTWEQTGIFGSPDQWQDVGAHTIRNWVLLRQATWAWVVVNFDPKEQWNDRRPPISVELEAASPEAYLEAGMNLESIWETLGVVMGAWNRRVQAHAEAASNLLATLRAEDSVLRCIRDNEFLATGRYEPANR